MAEVTSGFVNTGFYSEGGTKTRCVQLVWSVASQNIATNQTIINYTLQGAGGEATWWVKAGGFTLTIDGQTLYHTSTDSRITLYGGTVITSGQFTMNHDANGNKSFSVSISAGIYEYAVNKYGSDTFTLPQIKRCSDISTNKTTYNVGDTVTVSLARQVSTYTHTVEFYFTMGNTSWSHSITSVGASCTYTLPVKDICEKFLYQTSGNIAIKATTYNGSTALGSKTTVITVNIPNTATYKPTLSSVTLADSSNISSNPYIKGKSTLKITLKATQIYSSPVSYKVTIGSKTYDGTFDSTLTKDLSINTNDLATGTVSISAYVIDGRKRQSATTTKSITVKDYTSPKCNIVSLTRDDNGNGKNAIVKYSYVLDTAIDTTASLKIYYLKGSTWTLLNTVSVSASNSGTQATYTTTGSLFNTNTGYKFKIEAIGKYVTSNTQSNLGTAFSLINFNADGDAITFGGVSTENKVFENNFIFKQKDYSFLQGHGIISAYAGGSSTTGYIKFASVNVVGNNPDNVITIKVSHSHSKATGEIILKFTNVALGQGTLSPAFFYTDLYGFDIFIANTGGYTWGLYYKRAGSYANLDVLDLTLGNEMRKKVEITFTDELCSSIPEGAVQATKSVELSSVSGNYQSVYRRKDGLQIVAMNYTISGVTPSSAAGSLYYASKDIAFVYPFVSLWSANITSSSPNICWCAGTSSANTTTVGVRIISPFNTTLSNFRVFITAVGRWF